MDVARKGDSCHPNCVVAESDPAVPIDGDPMAIEGRETICGARLMPAMPAWGRP
jgi:uncharacterized Zn-binding protein involved in type VI secretion